ncbi:phosphoenolpyruvate carboxykinase (ATP) [bacterium]|nr:phosphoenolpyruvate carboxykinase (ATP) [bacterium]
MSKYLKLPSPAQAHCEELKSDYGVENHGLVYLKRQYWNLPTSALIEEAIFRNEGHLVNGGPLLVYTGKWTARAAADKYIVKEPTSEDNIWWNEYSRPMTQDAFDQLFNRVQAYLQGEEIFIQDVHVGADPEFRMPIRIIAEKAWQAHFARNQFITIDNRNELHNHVPEFTLIAVPSMRTDERVEGTRTETAIVINFARRICLVVNSQYGGEIKKSIFTVMNYLLPLKGVLSMHCSANVGKNKDVALFFGLSGTGKTTLSADPTRDLIGDDEHGWSNHSVFNLEGGCYAKVIRLSSEHEPEIYATTRRFGTILENVVYDPATRLIDLDDEAVTENTRATYPLDFIPNLSHGGMAEAHPKNIIFLTCDAQGVLPPIARLDRDQAIYHFISGYTSKIAGTEIGLGIEPKITFSACFGAPFMVHHPFRYAEMLAEKSEAHGAQCWLVNTGWVGGKFGVGKRISIRHTRNLLNAALDGKLDQVEYRKDKLFGFEVPLNCPDVPEDVLDPSTSWGNKDEYWKNYDALAARYIENFKKFSDGCPENVRKAGPIRLSQLH